MATRFPWLLLASIAAACAGAPGRATAGDGFSAGIDVKAQASDAELGVPVYPGAVRRLDKDDDSDSANVSLWGGDFGLKVVAAKYSSNAPLDRVAGFYRDALGRYGPVLDCDQAQAQAPGSAKRRDDGSLHCDDDETARVGRHVYKVGTERHQRLVHLQQDGDLLHIDVVRIELRD